MEQKWPWESVYISGIKEKNVIYNPKTEKITLIDFGSDKIKG